jgi:3-hydroxybutyrate dehydrogenase
MGGDVLNPLEPPPMGDISLAEAEKKFLQGRQPTDRFIEPEKVGGLIAFLCSDAASEITGASIPIDDAWIITP